MASTVASKAVAAACVIPTAVAAFFALRWSQRQPTPYSRLSEAGEEEDKEHLDESLEPQPRSSAIVCRSIAPIGSLAAFFTAVWLVLLSFQKPREIPRLESLLFACGWFVILFQTFLFSKERSSVKRFDIGLSIAGSCISLLAGIGFVETRGGGSMVLAGTVEAIAGIATALAAISVDKQPVPRHQGRPVDAQDSCSAWTRYTFSWARPLLDKARKYEKLNDEDLPALHPSERSATLFHGFKREPLQPLWRAVIQHHKHRFILQWGLTALESFLMVSPQFCLFKLLSLLERRASEGGEETELWLWAVALVVLKTAHLFCDSWIEWTNFALLATPIRSQLSALIYAKSLLLKDVKTMGQAGKKEERKDSVNGSDDFELEELIPEHERGDAGKDDEETEPAVAQEATNLLGIDVQRVSDFAGYNVLIPGSILKLMIAVGFLVSLIGWWSTLAGLAVPLIFQPLNQVATRGYSGATEAVMVMRDEKTHVVTEALHGIRQIKFSALEPQWQQLIMASRERELGAQWRAFKWATFMIFCWLSMPILLGASALGTYAWLNGHVSASVAFTALSIFTTLEWTLSVVPTTVTELMDAKVSISRIQQHLDQPNGRQPPSPGDEVCFEGAAIRWPSEAKDPEAFILRNINLRFPQGQLSVVHGKTGAGKSMLLQAILGEADIMQGTVRAPVPEPAEQNGEWITPGAKAFVGQVPWLENASLRDNILFGQPFVQRRYNKVIKACALRPDLDVLPDGDATEIGAAGINLSGGQRWRVTLARALYSRASILVLDDIFSAVDAHVGRHIATNALQGELARGRTRILVTHHVGLAAPLAAYVVELDGRGGVAGSVSQQTSDQTVARQEADEAEEPGEGFEDVEMGRPEARKFVEDEGRQEGRVQLEVYKAYMAASGGTWHWVLMLGLYVASALSALARSYWIKHWTQQADTTEGSEHLQFYLAVYLAISAFASLSMAVKTLAVLRSSIRASRKLFEQVTYNVLRAPMRWLDTEPTGRVLNRFASDFALVDSRLAGDFNWSAHGVLSVVVIVCAALVVTPLMALPVAALGAACIHYTRIYLAGARDVKRLESTARSPLLELAGASLAGLSTIRAYARSEDFRQSMFSRIDAYARSSWHLLLAARWMAFRQGAVGNAFALCAAAAVISLREADASLAGFALTFTLEYPTIAMQTIARYTGFELDMSSTERVAEYVALRPEEQGGHSAPPDWPAEGRVEVRGLVAGYAPDLPPVLKGISFSVAARQRVGVVGRTGSGKSSLALALFRLLTPREGSVAVDGVDLATLRVSDVRSRLAIIPQDPVLFSGTLRANLDPFDEHSDAALTEALRRVRLDEHSALTDLQTPIARGGLNLSQGQRQLLCLARAIVRHPRVMVLDEATSAVDMATDALIQQSIRDDFAETTLLVIAHRLSTIADFDKVLVLDDGHVLEYDHPAALMQERGPFWEMVCKSGERAKIEQMLGNGDLLGDGLSGEVG